MKNQEKWVVMCPNPITNKMEQMPFTKASSGYKAARILEKTYHTHWLDYYKQGYRLKRIKSK